MALRSVSVSVESLKVREREDPFLVEETFTWREGRMWMRKVRRPSDSRICWGAVRLARAALDVTILKSLWQVLVKNQSI